MDLPWLLQSWRTRVDKRPLREVAALMDSTARPASASLLGMWEHGTRHPSRAQLHRLDAVYNADGALAALADGHGTTTGLAPRRVWAHNFQGDSGPVFAWITPHRGRRLRGVVRWGAFAVDLNEEPLPRGVLITTPFSMTNPAAWVFIRAPGWVHFGRGTIPAALGIPIIDSLTRARLVPQSAHSPAGLVSPELIDRYRTDDSIAERVTTIFAARPDLVDELLTPVTIRRGVENLIDTTPRRPDTGATVPFTGAEFKRLRRARRFSRRQAAHDATELDPAAPISPHHIELLESGGNPTIANLRLRLDLIYQADGISGTEPSPVTRGRLRGANQFSVALPRYWVGPCWFHPTSPGGDDGGTVTIRWGDAQRTVRVRAGTTITCRKPSTDSPDPTLTLPATWRLDAGVGHHPHALDVNWGWHSTEPHTPELIHPALLEWFGITDGDLTELADTP